MPTEKRQRQKEGHRLQQEAIRRYQKSRARRRRLFIYGGLVVAFFGVLFVYSLIQDDEGEDAATTTSVPSSTTTPVTALPAPTECPPAEGVDEPVRLFSEAPPTCIDPARSYTAVLRTSEGPIRVELDTANTPETVNNFVVLARYGYYDRTEIFRTDPSIGIIQGGGSDNSASPGYTIPDEGDGYTYEPGQLVMARTGDPNSAGGQFFLVGTDAAEGLNAQGTYVVFGTTDQAGIDVINAILERHVEDDSGLGGHPEPRVGLRSVAIQES
jgi:cyclophilin family peptidyl-prolyl cis-trans isomerase